MRRSHLKWVWCFSAKTCVDIQLKSDQVEFQICTGDLNIVGLDLAFELLPTQGAMPSNFSLIRAAAIKEKKY